MSHLHEKRVEAAAKAMWERTPRKDDPTWADLDYGIKEIWRKDARAALAAADAHLPSVEQIAEVLYDEFVTRTDLSMIECERTACAVRALFGEVAGDDR